MVRMKEPAQTLIGEDERVVSALPDAVLFPGSGGDGLRRFEAAMGAPPPPGLAAFLAAHDGGVLGSEVRLLTLEEAAGRLGGRSLGAGAPWPPGLWPVVDRAGRRYALDAEDLGSEWLFRATVSSPPEPSPPALEELLERAAESSRQKH